MVATFIQRWFGRPAWSLDRIRPPWSGRSIYEHIKEHARPGESVLSERGYVLPDEERITADHKLAWAPGAFEGVLGHAANGSTDERADRLHALLKSALAQPTQQSVSELYRHLNRGNSFEVVDALLSRIRSDREIDPGRLHDLARWIAAGASDREPVKLAIALLGILRGVDDREIVLTLARHDEFTLWSAVAISNQEENPDRVLWEIAKGVSGWGRVNTVDRLAKTTDPEIKGWLLREGYKNSVMYEYLAYTCAVVGDLKAALSADQIDEPLLLGAGDLLATLISGQGGPAEGIDEYADGVTATELYLNHVEERARTITQFLVLQTIDRFVADKDQDWSERATRGWTPEVRQSMHVRIQAIVRQERWRDVVERGLESDDRCVFWEATVAAKHLGIDPWDEFYARTAAGEDHWYQLMQTEDRSRAASVAELAASRLRLADIASGPGRESGFGPKFRDHTALDFVLQGLSRFPGLGWNLVRAGLRSPVIRNRNLALRVLAEWTEEHWSGDARAYIETCRSAEPDDRVKVVFDKVLAGRSDETND